MADADVVHGVEIFIHLGDSIAELLWVSAGAAGRFLRLQVRGLVVEGVIKG